MRITTKLALIISVLLIVLFIALSWNSYRHGQSLIQQQAIEKARIISRQIIETRDYLSRTEHGEAEQNYALVPQVVASRVANKITADSPYYVRQVSLRNRNPENRPDQYEAAELARMSATTVPQESSQVVGNAGKEALRYLLPMIADKSCLSCHGSFEMAPRFVQERFPKGHHSYNYRAGEMIGAISVSVPMRELYRSIDSNLFHELAIESTILLLLLVLTGWIIHRAILKPVSTVAKGIEQVTSSGNYARRIEQPGNDEIGHLVASFNELMAELERRTLQRAESDERYRNFIEIAQSPIVTFLPDGKIVIANQKAEKLFGLTKEELLGQSICAFMSDPEPLKAGIRDYFQAGSSSLIGTTSHQTVRDVCGRLFEVEMVISVSQTDQEAMFTAILRTVKMEQAERYA
jgi:PAS domain S-box-containing protein